MPSVHDDSAGPPTLSTPRSAAPENPGNQPLPGAGGDCWLGNYLVGRMTAAGVDHDLARRVADEMQPDIVAAFATLARLEPRGTFA